MKTNDFLRVNLTPVGRTPWVVSILCILLLFAQLSFGEDFTAHHLGDYGNVTVMEVNGNFDEQLSGGTENVAARQTIAKEFFLTHKDEYDSLVIFTNFDYRMKPDGRIAFYSPVKNDVRGIGQQIFDNGKLYGSNGRLYGTIDMGNYLKLISSPLDPAFNFTVDTLIHETLHRWAAFVRFKDWNGSVSDALLGQDKVHWSFLLDSGGSTLYGNKWKVNGDGTFTSTAIRKYYSPLDLYVMGMIDKSKVPPTLLIDNPTIDPAKAPEIGDTISGTARYVNIDDIIAVQDQGERVPNAKDSQKQFKTAFIYAVSPGTFKSDDLYGIENLRNAYLTRFSILTDGKGLVQVTSTPKDNLPVNPGIRPPSIVPRTLPPSIDNGVTWLMNHQQSDGSWTDFSLTTERDTAESVTTLQHFPVAAQSFQAGFTWLGNNSSANTDYLCRRIEAAVQTGSDSSVLVQELLARRNPDGGWGSNRNFISTAIDTALALKALAVAGYSDRSVTGPAIAYLQGAQNSDGGWSGDDAFSSIQPTAAVLTAFNVYRKNSALETNLTKAMEFLASKLNPDGGFGNSPSTVYDSALAVIALQVAGADKALSGRGVSYLQGQQSENGAWFDSTYQTALAIRAVWAATVNPDLSLNPEDVSVIPATITSIPTNAVLSATVWNLGRSDVQQAKVAVYDGIVVPDKKVAEQIAAFPGQSPVTLSFSIPVNDSKGHFFHVVVDPDNFVAEQSKNNNSALKPLMPEITYDFQVQASDITVSPNPANIYQDVKIAVKVTNSGTSDAFSVPVRIFIEQPGAPMEIALLTVDIPAGGSAIKETIWRASLAGAAMPLIVQIDPNNTFSETSKNNNSAFVPLTVIASTLPNLSVSHKDMVITPTPARERGNAAISVLVKNDGFSTAENVKVNVYNGTDTNGGILLGSQVIPAIQVGQSLRTVIDWTGIAVNGGQVITVRVDPDSTLPEITKDDNFTFLNLDVLSLPDLAISTNSIVMSPATPKSGDAVTIAVTVQNGGEQEARDVTVRIREGGSDIGSTVIPLVNGSSQATGTITYANSDQTGTHQISVTVDPGNLIVERTKDNNSSVNTFSIQDANLWLTESYISPNGDDIKDTTDFSFRLAAATKVSVQVVNKKGIAVRTFSGGELNSTPGATIIWDGKNDAGSVVNDGTYQIKVINANSALLASLPVEVDTNRSPLADALGTKYLLQNNQTCSLPIYDNLTWLPDESGLVFQLFPVKDSAYLDGLYAMDPTGVVIFRLIPDLWNSMLLPDVTYTVQQHDMTKDGQKMAFVLRKGEKNTGYGGVNYSSSLWVVNTDGSNLTKVFDFTEIFGPEKIVWSPDGSKIAVVNTGLYIFNPSTKEMKYVAQQGYTFSGQMEWSPDGSMVYAFSYNYAHGFSLSDPNGVGGYFQDQSLSYGGNVLGWIWDKKILFTGNDYNTGLSQTTLFDAKDGTFTPLVVDGSDLPTISPDRQYLAWSKIRWNSLENNYKNEQISVMDRSQNIMIIAQSETNSDVPSGISTGIGKEYVWSKDGSALAYVYTSYSALDNTVHDEIVIHDMEKGTDRRIEVSSYVCQGSPRQEMAKAAVYANMSGGSSCTAPNKITKIIAWMKDKINFLFETSEGVFSFNSDEKTSSGFLPVESGTFLSFSPNERFLTYEKYNASNGSCFPKYNNQWAMSSLLNLVADLKITKNKSVIKLSGIASDKNFAGYRLEFADIKTPDSWSLIMPPSDVPVLSDKFIDWVPPNDGSFYVRLTVWDSAGNVATDRKRVSWGISTLVTGMYRVNELIAPKNPDNPKKSVALHYTALDAVHLEFSIVNEKGETVRSFSREHSGYAVDSIAWDGRDEAGNFVPDGKYLFKLFDYEFTVEVDNTPPDASIDLGPIEYHYKQNDSDRSYYFVNLTAAASDLRLKKWAIQVGEGENPSVWTAVESNTETISNYVRIYINSSIAHLKNVRFRIVVEDFVGNLSTKTSNFVNSRVILASVQLSPTTELIVPPDSQFSLVFPKNVDVESTLSGFETVSDKTSKVVLQYSERGSSLLDVPSWVDIQEKFDSGLISFKWKQPITTIRPYALRFKVVTEGNATDYSGILTANEEFRAVAICNGGYFGRNALFEQLQKLDVTVSTPSGHSIKKTYVGKDVPIDFFELTMPSPPETPDVINVEMKGTGISGKSYVYTGSLSNKSGGVNKCNCPPTDPYCKEGGGGESGGGGGGGGSAGGGGSTLPFNAIYPEALACGKTSGEIQLPTERLSLTGAKRVTYLVKVGSSTQVIGEVDIEIDGLRRVSVDSSLLPMGSYPLSVVVTNKDNTQKQTDLGKVIVFDTEAPQAQLTLPVSPCPVRTATPKGTRLGIDISGSATDNIRVAHYTLYYGIGENPKTYSQAMSVSSDGSAKPIAGDGAFSGRLGTWDFTDIPGSVFTLKLEVVDSVGNKGCATGVVTLDREIKINGFTLSPLLFSPNSDAFLDTATSAFNLDEPATVDLCVYTISKDVNGSEVLGAVQRRVQNGLKFTGGAAIFDWDGKGDSGAILPDNRYAISLAVTDVCGNTATQWKSIELDVTPPSTSIDYPLPGNPLPPGVMIEIKGTATDPHFKSYLLEVGEGDNPTLWNKLTNSDKPVSNVVIAPWNTFGMKDHWTLRLSSEDVVGNKKVVSSTIDLGVRKELVKILDATPKLISPNNDQKLDTSTISYEVTDACNLKIDILDGNGQVVRTFTAVTTTAGKGSIVWDGKNSLGAIVADGVYAVRLVSSLTAKPDVNQTETITLTLDTSSPAISITDVTDKSYLNRTDLSIAGTINDAHLVNYSIAIAGPAGTATLDTGTQNRANYTFGRITDLAEDTYTLTIDASDQGENQVKFIRTLNIDRTPPKVTLDSPRAGDYFGNTKNIIDITGAIVEKNLDKYTLRYGAGEVPTEWIEVVGGNTIPTAAKLSSLKVGKTDGIADGIYTISLNSKDKVGQEGEVKAKIVIDNTPPLVAITAPKDGAYVTKSLDIKGMAADSYFDKGTLELAEGSCTSASKWTFIKALSAPVQDGALDSWKVLPADGEYCLRLSATDKSGNNAETKIGVKIDTHPPVAPVLAGKIDNKVDALLIWTKNTEPDLAGYNVYRNGQKLTTALLIESTYRDPALKEGSYVYSIKAVDFAGNESDPSNLVTLKVDLTGPTVRIATPSNGTAVSNLIDIKGTAYSQDDFKEYRLSIGQGSSPSSWTLIRRSPLSISYGTLAQWDTITSLDGAQFTLKLEGEDLSGNISTTQTLVAIDNTAPKAPVLLTTTASSADVALTWKANTESDLAGYLLYRNDQLANVKGIVAGNLKPYLVAGAAYSDKTLPDGVYRYYLVAMDQAGNTSDQSNTLEVAIDTHPPHMTITAPANGFRFDGKFAIKVESPDNDIAAVQFQYKCPQDAIWSNIGTQFVKPPYVSYLDPKTLNLAYGNYQIQVLSTDLHNNFDPAPAVILVTYTDLTPPAVVSGLAAKVNGADVTLTWSANSETDLAGYNVYRWSKGERTKASGGLITTATYKDSGVPDGNYQYEITAVDASGNESAASGQVAARIYAPLIAQPFTPVKTVSLVLEGGGAEPGSSVEITTVQAGVVTNKSTVTADPAGAFKLEGITLALGENRFSAIATDLVDNVSKASDTSVVVYGVSPTAPTGLEASDNGYDVHLNWNANSETNIVGYNLFRDGKKVNTAVSLTGGLASASFQDYYSKPQYAIDSNNNTNWSTPYGNGRFTPAWWQMALPAPELINTVSIDWAIGDWDYTNSKYNILAGKDYEIQAWSGYNWITLKKVVGNDQQNNTIDISPSYRTDQVRIAISSTTDQSYSKYVRINEIRFHKDSLIPLPVYTDPGLLDHSYAYKVTAINSFGFESNPSAPVGAVVGDVAPPAAPANLTATAQGADILLDWSLTPHSEPDLAGYKVYRLTAQEWTLVGSIPASTTSFTDVGLINGAYSYRITAYDQVGNESNSSNEASAIVAIVSPPAPPTLIVASPPEGKGLNASWQPAGGSGIAYNIYRSNVSGGAYARLNSSPLTVLSYQDSGLLNGTYYYYVTTSIDTIGNESAYSNEASGVPRDLFAPDRPVIFTPTRPGAPLIVYQNAVAVTGISEPGSNVELLRGADVIGKATALKEDNHTSIVVDAGGYYPVLSPNGTSVVFNNNSDIWFKVFSSGSLSKLAQNASAWNATWSPDGGKVAYSQYDSSWNQRVGLFDIASAKSSFLTDDTGVNESSQSWSGDGTRISFASNRSGNYGIWLKNLTDNSLIQVADNVNVSKLSLSPDATKIAYFSDQNLYLINIADGKVSQLDGNTDQASIAWAPDASKVAYVSYRDGYNGLFVTDLTSLVTSKILGSTGNYFSQLGWSPDGTKIVFSQSEDYGASLHMIGLNGEQTTLLDSIGSINNLSCSKDGIITFSDGNNTHILKLKSIFTVSNVQLVAGENSIYAVATDDSGNASSPSDPITVVFDTGHLPDLAITDSDITLFPAYPKPGDDVLVTARVHNPTSNAVDNATVELYLWDGSNDVTLLKSEIIPHLDANGEGNVSVRFNAGTTMGSRTVIAVADPSNLIQEILETNNYTSRDLVVTDKEQVSVSTSLSSLQYGFNQDADIVVNLMNSGTATTGTLKIMIEDSDGNLVKLLASQARDLPYGYDRKLAFTWNTGTTYAGSYKVYALVADSAGSTILAENATLFSILPDLQATGTVTTDKQTYGSGEPVNLGITFKNSGVNHVIPQLKVRVRIVDALNTQLFSEEKTFTNLLPSMGGSFTSTWNTGLSPAGAYSAVVDLSAGNQVPVSKSAAFTILARPLLKGTLSVDTATVLTGRGFNSTYAISNQGNSAATGTARITLQDPDSQTIVASFEQPATIAVNSSLPGTANFDTTGLTLKTYQVVLWYKADTTWQNIAMTTISIKDGIAPTISIISPQAGASYTKEVSLSVLATDDSSGVDRVEYNIDNGAWKVLPFADPSTGRCSIALTLSPTDNGGRTAFIRGTDRAGNVSQPVSVNYVAQSDTIPPVLSVSTLPDGSYTNNEVLNITGTVTDNVGVKELLINGTPVPVQSDGSFSQALVLVDGANTIAVIAADQANNQANVIRIITLDRKAPLIDVISPADNSKTGRPQINVTGYVDESSVVKMRLNGNNQPVTMTGNAFSAILVPEYGYNTIEIIATDPAGNHSSEKRTVIFDDRKPSLAVTEPGQDIRTNRDVLILKGTVADTLTAVTLTITMAGQTFSPVVTNGAFEQRLVMTEEKNHAIVVTATDEVGNSISVQRNVIFDITPPTLTINPVENPTNQPSVTVSGTREEGSTVEITCTGAVAGTIEYPGVTTWSAALNSLTSGDITITATATDSAGNETTAATHFIYDITPPTSAIAINSGAGITTSSQVSLTLIANDANGVARMQLSNDNTNWTPSESFNSTRDWSLLPGDGLKQVFVKFSDTAGNWSTAIGSTIILDTTPPSVSATPAGGIFGAAQNVGITTSELSVIHYTTDGTTPCVTSAVYSAPLSITTTTTLRYLAIDSAGNRSDIHTVTYIIDTIPPLLQVSTLPDGSYTNNEVINVGGTVSDDQSGVKELKVNGTTVTVQPDGSFSQAVVLARGANTITVIAMDQANNQISDIRTINLDQAAPNLVIIAPADNSKTATSLTTVRGTVDETATVTVKLGGNLQTAIMDGANFIADVNLAPGTNTIEVTATDLAGNTSTQKRTVVYDDQKPSLAITLPAQDIRTNQANLTIRGTASDPYTAVTVSIVMDGKTYTPAVVNGHFEQAVSFTTEKSFAILVTATNEVGSFTTAQRNVIFDVTPPALTINPVTSPTIQPDQIISGTREAGATVGVTCASAVVGTIQYPASTTWSVQLSNLVSGDNTIIATSIDGAGNPATASAKITYSPIVPDYTFKFAVFGNKNVSVSGGCYTDSYIGNPASRSYGKYKHGDVGTNSLQPCGIQLNGGVAIFGKALVGAGGNPANGVCINGGSSVYNNATGTLSSSKDMKPKTDPGGGTSMGALVLTSNTRMTLPAGSYRFTKMNLSGNSKLTLNGNVTLYLDGDLMISGSAGILISSGRVVIYVNGKKVDISGGSFVNTSLDPRNLILYGTPGLQTINLTGGTSLYGLVYAPTAAITVSGGQNTFGSLIGNTVDLSGGVSVHYDENLVNGILLN